MKVDNYEQLIINKLHSAMIEAGLIEAAEVLLLNHALGMAELYKPARAIIVYYAKNIEIGRASKLLARVNRWTKTPQGQEYWDDVYNALIKWEERRK